MNTLLVVLSLLAFRTVNSVVPPPAPFRGADGELEDMEFRVAVPPGKMECFHQEAKEKHQLEVSYTVIEISSRFGGWLAPTGRAELNLDFTLTAPNGEVVVKDIYRTEGSHVHTVVTGGTYTLCFDNSMSSVSTKIVNVEVYLYSNEDDDRWGYFEETGYTFSPEIQAMETVENIKASVNKVRDDLIKITHSQDERRAIERRDRNIVEKNYEYVNRFSIFSIIAFGLVGGMQVVLIRSLFEEKSMVKTLIKKVKGY
jgi:protein ERP2